MSPVKEWTVTEPYIHIGCEVGEAPFYSEEHSHFRFVDIPKQKLHLVDLNVGPSSLRTLDLRTLVSVTVDVEGNHDMLFVGAKPGFAKLDLTTGNHEISKLLEGSGIEPGKLEHLRLNDGAVDSHGRFFAGACNDPKLASPANEGILFRLDPDLSLHQVLEDLALPNGIGWSVSEDTMYLTESLSRNIYAFSYSPSTGEIRNKRVFFHLNPKEGAPDGLAVDAENHIWVTIYGGGKVLRISPEGEVVGFVKLPTRCVTCAAFVGEELFITSGADPEPDKYVRSGELGGSVFRVNVGIEGRAINRWRGI